MRDLFAASTCPGWTAAAMGLLLAVGCGGEPLGPTNNNNVSDECGNGAVDPGEVCDGYALSGNSCSDLGLGFTGGSLRCLADCSDYDTTSCVTLPDCGDGDLDPGEVCDGADLAGEDCVSQGYDQGDLACRPDCAGFDNSGCENAVDCGNGVVDAGEDCDGVNLNGQDCTTLGLGFTGGTLACGAGCGWDTSQCEVPVDCGNGVVDLGETCDGANLAGQDCSTLGLGFTGGALACNPGCNDFDTTGCTGGPSCGDGSVDTPEVCDGANLDGQDCTTLGLGFTGGTLACNASCTAWNTAGCTGPGCGNDVIDTGELCDGVNLAGQSCTTIGLGFTGGTLACSASCTAWNTAGCTAPFCGDGNIDTNELCDGANLGGHSCSTIGMGFDGGTLACNAACSAWDTSLCTTACPGTHLGSWTGADINQTVNTCSGNSNYGGNSVPCLPNGWPAPGEEVLRQLTLSPGDSVYVYYTPPAGADPSLYVLADCFDTAGNTCVEGSDEIGNGIMESVTLSNTSSGPITYTIVLDNWSGCGMSNLLITEDSCGNGAIDAGELCDGADLGGEGCTSIGMGFTGGNLACNASCSAWNTAGCFTQQCGNNTAEGTEVCDGADLRGQTCVSQGFAGGPLSCNFQCNGFNTSQCLTQLCGNNTAEGTEVCDGADLRGESCTTIGGGFTGGTLGCNFQCNGWNTTGCTFTCQENNLGFWTATPLYLSGNTCTGTDLYSPTTGPGSCTGYGADGMEVVYGLTLPGGATVNIDYAAGTDNSLYVITSCTNFSPASCVVGADENMQAPFSESVVLSNPTLAPVHYYIIADNWANGQCSAYTLNITP